MRGIASSLAVFVVSFVGYGLLLQSQPYGDGITYLSYLSKGTFLSHHLLYLPDLWLFSKAATACGIDARTAPYLFSAFCGAFGNAVLHRLIATSRKTATDCSCPLLLTLLAATVPSIVFFATQVENHAHHYAWVCLLLLTLDRALASDAFGRWAVCGVALLGAYASHSSIILMLPALVLLIHALRGHGPARLPRPSELARFGVWLAPVVVFRLLEGTIRADLLGGGEAWRQNTSFAFLRSLLGLRDLSTWLHYLWAELLLPAFGLVWVVLVVAVRRWRIHRADMLLAGLAVVPYVLVFGHWNVYERGAYYIPLLPVLIVTMARLRPDLRREERIVIVLLVLGQAGYAVHAARTWVERQTGAAWTVASDASRLATRDGTVLVWPGVLALHLDYDHHIEAVPLENWVQELGGRFATDPKFGAEFAELVRTDFVEKYWLAKHGPLLIERGLMERLRADQKPDLRPLASMLETHYRLTPVAAGTFHAFRVERR